MTTQPCKCCENNKTPLNPGHGGYSYNRVCGNDAEWAKENGEMKPEFTVPVKGGKRFGGKTWQKIKCGDGTMGFSTRRKGQEEVQMEVGMDGQFKKSRHTLVRPKSARCSSSRKARRVDGSRCSLVSSVEMHNAARDPLQVERQRKVYKKSQRAKKRNNKARHGHKIAVKMAA